MTRAWYRNGLENVWFFEHLKDTIGSLVTSEDAVDQSCHLALQGPVSSVSYPWWSRRVHVLEVLSHVWRSAWSCLMEKMGGNIKHD